MFTQPTPLLSLGSDLRSPSLISPPSPTPAGEQTSLSGWWVLVSTDPLCGNLSALPSAPLLLCSPPWLRSFPPTLPTPCLCQSRGFLVCGNVSYISLPEVEVLSLFFCLCFFFFLCPTQVRGNFVAFWEVWGLLPVCSRCSVGVVPHVDVFLMYLWGGRWSPHLTSLPSWRSDLIVNFLKETCDPVKYRTSIKSLHNSKVHEQVIEEQTQEPHKGIHFGVIAVLPGNLLLWKLNF